MDLLVALSFGLAVAAALRSTWSPCGLSMLSSINPVGERGRGHRYGRTAAWYVAGSVAGGLCLGAAMGGVAGLLRLVAPPTDALLLVAAAVAALGAAGDLGASLPLLRRQVDERWLDRYRPWVYGAGFGWQIGVGFATYLMTFAVVVFAVLGAATTSPAVALAAGATFGLARGLTILVGCRSDRTERLLRTQRRLDRLAGPSRLAVAAAQLATAVALAAVVGWPEAVVALAVVVLLARPALRPAAPRSPAA